MTTPYQAPHEAKFYLLPDGTQSSIQMKVGPDGQPAPLAVRTPQQLAEWDQIQAAAPPSPSQADAKLMASLARPLFNSGAEADDASGASLLNDLRSVAAATDAVSVTTELNAPRNQAEYDQRVAAAASLAVSLDLRLVWVPVTDAFGNDPHLELRQFGNTYTAGDLVTLEAVLRNLASERASRDAKIELFRAYQERLARERAEAIANLPENRLARLEAALVAKGIDVGV